MRVRTTNTTNTQRPVRRRLLNVRLRVRRPPYRFLSMRATRAIVSGVHGRGNPTSQHFLRFAGTHSGYLAWETTHEPRREGAAIASDASRRPLARRSFAMG